MGRQVARRWWSRTPARLDWRASHVHLRGGTPMDTKPPTKLHHGPDDRSASASRRAYAHEERMIDQSVEQSFPASDPPATSQPGSIAWRRYAAVSDVSRGSFSPASRVRWFVIMAAIACTALILQRLRRR